MSSKVILRAVRGALEGKTFEFAEADNFVFGRALDCHGKIPEDDQYSSRYQFLLEAVPPRARIRDLGSLNGTSVNGVLQGKREAHETVQQGSQRQFPSIELKDGDRIDVGDTSFVVEIVAPPPSGPAPTQLRAAPPMATAPMTDREANAKIQEMVAALLGGLGQKKAASDLPAIPGYTFERELGRGAMGAVLLAHRDSDRGRFAVKMLLPRVAANPSNVKMFLRGDVLIASHLQHPNIVRTHESGQAGGAFYVVMEVCEGGSLDDLMASRGGRLSLEEAAPLMLQMLDGLEYAHNVEVSVELVDGQTTTARGIVHRDLKPQNVLLGGQPGRWVAKLTDFGLAKSFNTAGLSGVTHTGAVGGTPCFMPREQVINYKKVRPISDIWALGASFYNMLTACTPQDFPPARDPIQIILQDRIVPIRERDPRVPVAVAGVIDKSLDRDPQQRFQTAAEFRAALKAALSAR